MYTFFITNSKPTMFELYTERLRLLALDDALISCFIQDTAEMDRRLGLPPVLMQLPEAFQAELKPALEEFCLPKIRAFPEQYLWFTHWVIIHREQQRRIGGLGSSGPPNEAGEIMIGYYIDKPYARQGFATEAAMAFCQRLKNHPDLELIIATTPIGHLASERVLQKCGFKWAESEEEGLNRWELKV